MSKVEIIRQIKGKFGNKIKDVFEKSYKRVYISVDPNDIYGVSDFMFNNLKARFNTTSCVDMPNGMELLYHFTVDAAGVVVSFRAYLDKKSLSIESITPLMKGAEWIEREIHELFGVEFRNHPNMKTLLLPEDWPEGLYPLRRDYKEEDYKARMAEKEKK